MLSGLDCHGQWMNYLLLDLSWHLLEWSLNLVSKPASRRIAGTVKGETKNFKRRLAVWSDRVVHCGTSLRLCCCWRSGWYGSEK